MRLRTRLIISFFIIIIVPVLLAGATIWGFGHYQKKAIHQLYNLEENPYDYFVNSFKVLSRITKSTYEELQKTAKEAPQKLEDLGYFAGGKSWCMKESRRLGIPYGRAFQSMTASYCRILALDIISKEKDKRYSSR